MKEYLVTALGECAYVPSPEPFAGHMQLEEAVRRIKEYVGLKRIIVCTNSGLAAPKNYESVGFVLYDRKPNETKSAYTGDHLYYELLL